MPTATEVNELERFKTIEEICEVLNIRKDQGYKLAREGILPVIKVGRHYRVDPRTFREWVKAGGQSFTGGWRKEAVAN